MSDLLIERNKVFDWGKCAFEKIGLSAQDSSLLTNALVETSLWGIDSHGVARIPHYLTRLQNGTINKLPNFNLIRTGSATARLDGDDGHGILIMNHAAEKAIEIANEAGTGVVGVFNSSHCGAIGLYTRRITKSGMVGIAFTHSDALVVPYGGNRAFFGTNPISIAFPTTVEDEPVCLDMATSIVPWNFVMNAKREKKNVKAGLGVDELGNDSIDSTKIVAVKPMADYKGFALAFLIDMLCGPLNNMSFGPNLTSMYKDLDKKRKLGSLVIAIDPERFGGIDYLRNAATELINQVKQFGEHVKFPGEPEYLMKKDRSQRGIPFTDTMIAEFNYWASVFSINSIAN